MYGSSSIHSTRTYSTITYVSSIYGEVKYSGIAYSMHHISSSRFVKLVLAVWLGTQSTSPRECRAEQAQPPQQVTCDKGPSRARRSQHRTSPLKTCNMIYTHSNRHNERLRSSARQSTTWRENEVIGTPDGRSDMARSCECEETSFCSSGETTVGSACSEDQSK